jgi:hypothetical protein
MNIQGVPGKAASISGPVSVCQNQTGVIYSISPISGATSYKWIAPEGASVVAGQGTNTATVNFGTNPGKVGVTGINACGQGGTKTTAVSISCREAGTAMAPGLEIFPNPVSDALYINLESIVKGQLLEVRITDISGRVVINSIVSDTDGSSTIALDVKALEAGPYLLSWSTATSPGIKKINMLFFSALKND